MLDSIYNFLFNNNQYNSNENKVSNQSQLISNNVQEIISNKVNLLQFDNNYIKTPIFFVDGFLCSNSLDIWHDLIQYFRHVSTLAQLPCPKLTRLDSGGLASAYDSAISLFYQIKGGIVDYGEEHSKKHYHDQFGITYLGEYPIWDENHPIHLCAHSFGGNVILLLQKFLDEKLFINPKTGEPYNTNANWIRSITTISSPMQGSTATLLLGHKLGQPGFVDFLSMGRAMYGLTHIWESLDLKSRFNYDLRMSHFGLNKEKNPLKLLKRWLKLELFEKGLDNAAYDLSIERCYLKRLKTFKGTYYRSYASKLTTTDMQTKREIPTNHWCIPLVLLSHKIGSMDFSSENYNHLDNLSKYQPLLRANDGIIPLLSQFHPQDCHPSTCYHATLEDIDFSKSIKKGVWYSSVLSNCSHIDIIPGIQPPLKSQLESLAQWMGASELKLNNYADELRNSVFNDYYKFLITVENQY